MNCNIPFSKIQIHMDVGVCGCKNKTITLLLALVLDLCNSELPRVFA